MSGHRIGIPDKSESISVIKSENKVSRFPINVRCAIPSTTCGVEHFCSLYASRYYNGEGTTVLLDASIVRVLQYTALYRL